MNIKIKAETNPIFNSNFNYGNIKSKYGIESLYFTKNEKPYMIVAGELHFSRVPRESWRRELLKMKECGLNTVSTYVFWNFHEEEKGAFDFYGNKDVKEFLKICKEIDMPCILRIGPWCHGEVVRGGFPKRINRMTRKRTNNPIYLKEVEDFWNRLYEEVKEYLDGETVLAIQIENEYSGQIDHIKTLKKLAEKIGYKAPFFTMTLWPSNKPDNELLPLVGGYPDEPWSGKRRKTEPSNRFAITPLRSDTLIGTDLIKNQVKSDNNILKTIPFASCETGPGNQVTNLRRPFISEKDGYGVCFAKFAAGCNWLGYYMFHGGRNPSGQLMQESRKTFYPNDCPIIDYDFQAPISRYGECRSHGDLLRLMHMFTKYFDSNIVTKNAYFPKWNSLNPKDISFLKCSVRMNEEMSGYFFVSTYEKNLKYNDFENVNVVIETENKSIKLPEVDIKAGSMFFYPFNIDIEDIHFDYITAQPIAKLNVNGRTTCYFVECEGVLPKYSVNGVEKELDINIDGQCLENSKIKLVVLPIEKAKELHIVNNQVVFSKGTVYVDDNIIYCETTEGYLNSQIIKEIDVKNEISFEKCDKTSLPHNSYLFSHSKKQYYSLKVPSSLLDDNFDVELKFNFSGLNLQVFSGKTIVNDYFNIDGNFVMRLREYKEYIENGELIFKTSDRTNFGAGHVYQEIVPEKRVNNLTLESAKVVNLVSEDV